MKTKYLYVFRIGQYLKVGITEDPRARFRQHATGNGSPSRPADVVGDCDSLFVRPASLDAEQVIHLLLGSLAASREWYPIEGLIKEWADNLRESRWYGMAGYAVGLRGDETLPVTFGGPACVMVEHLGRSQSISDWARELGINPNTLEARLVRGWTIERAVSQPVRQRRSRAVVASVGEDPE